MLVKLADVLPIDLKTLSAAHDGRLVADLMEAFGRCSTTTRDRGPDVREFAAAHGSLAHAVLPLYQAYRGTRESAQNLAAQGCRTAATSMICTGHIFPTQEVSDLVQRHMKYFPELESGAEALARNAVSSVSRSPRSPATCDA